MVCLNKLIYNDLPWSIISVILDFSNYAVSFDSFMKELENTLLFVFYNVLQVGAIDVNNEQLKTLITYSLNEQLREQIK